MTFKIDLVLSLSWYIVNNEVSCYKPKHFCCNLDYYDGISLRMGYVEWSRKFEYSSVTEKDFNFKRMNAEIETAVQENLHPENNKIIITGNKKVRQDFYKHFSNPLRNGCEIVKRFGGQIKKNGRIVIQGGNRIYDAFETGAGVDGYKSICLDNVYKAIRSKNCLIYSFGLSDDWTFEQSMASLGCKVHGFDPTVDENVAVDEIVNGISFSRLALYRKRTDDLHFGTEFLQKGLPLSDILQRFNDSKSDITVLKLDVEGEEILSLPQMVKSVVLRNVQQIHLEVHTNENVSTRSDGLSNYEYDQLMAEFMDSLKSLEIDYGFSIVSYNPNEFLGRDLSKGKQYYSFFDIVFCRN